MDEDVDQESQIESHPVGFWWQIAILQFASKIAKFVVLPVDRSPHVKIANVQLRAREDSYKEFSFIQRTTINLRVVVPS